MGRMSEARKKARQKAESRSGSADTKAAPDLVPAEAPGEAAVVAEPTSDGTAAPEDPFVFPAEPAAESQVPRGRFELPSSGLAADILAREGALLDEGPDTASLAPSSGPEAALAREEAAPAKGQSISFFSSPAREERAATEESEHLATFFLDREEYGVDVRLVQEIRRLTEITQVPRAPEFIKGVINLRGRIIPVIDLKKKLGLGEVAATKVARIVVVTLRGRLMGLLVDGASQVLKVPVSLVEAAPEEVVQKGGDYLRGVAKLEKRLIILVDLETVLAVELREGSQESA